MKEKIIYWLKKIFWPVAVFLMMIVLTGCGNTGNGSTVGYITTIDENNGLIFKDIEVYIKTNMQSTGEDVYCVEDKDVLSQLKKFKDDGTKVNIIYKGELVTWPSRCHNSITEKNKSNTNGYLAFIIGVQAAELK